MAPAAPFCWAWVLFFLGMGVLNLYVAYNFSESTWVNFKMWGGLGLMLVFGQRMMNWWMTFVARSKSQELFVLNVLLITLGLAWLTELADKAERRAIVAA